MLGSPHHIFPVVDAKRAMVGVVTLDQLRPFLFEEGLHDVAVARDLAVECPETLSASDDLQVARETFLRSGLHELPVVDPATGRVAGILREHELHAAYNRAVAAME